MNAIEGKRLVNGTEPKDLIAGDYALEKDHMKALSLTQPWATLVALGEKKVETRSWNTAYRGPIAIHAAKGLKLDDRKICQLKPFWQVLKRHGLFEAGCAGTLPRGAIVAVATLQVVRRIDPISFHAFLSNPENEQEVAFGNYDDGRYAWLFNAVRPIEPIPCKGALGLWEVPDAIKATIVEQWA